RAECTQTRRPPARSGRGSQLLDTSGTIPFVRVGSVVMSRCRSLVLLLLLLAPLVGGAARHAHALPPGFVRVPVEGTTFDQPVGMTFDENGRMYVWERGGRVWIVENGVQLPSPLVDISEEVNNARDHGMLGFALHPNFLENGWIYLFYAV